MLRGETLLTRLRFLVGVAIDSGVSASECCISVSRRDRRPTLLLDEGGILHVRRGGGEIRSVGWEADIYIFVCVSVFFGWTRDGDLGTALSETQAPPANSKRRTQHRSQTRTSSPNGRRK